MNKPELRRAMQGLLRRMDEGDREERSARIIRRLQESAAWIWMDTLLSFLSMPHEIATTEMIRSAQGAGKPVGVPRIEGRDIRFLVIPAGVPTPPRDRWGIPVPDSSWPALEPARAGRVLVCAPGLAFDRHGNRLGRGRGYYDRFLSRARADGARLLVIGVCFSEQLVDGLPHTEADQAVDGIVTDREMLLFDRAGLIR